MALSVRGWANRLPWRWPIATAANTAWQRTLRWVARQVSARKTWQRRSVASPRTPLTAAALRFALKLVNERGNVGESDLQAMRQAGFTDEQTAEVLAHVALNIFTNYVNLAFAVPVDFPPVRLSRAA